jgi:hypothetical protein
MTQSGQSAIRTIRRFDIRKHYIAATTFFSVVLVYVAVSMLAVPTLDTFEAIDRFFNISLAGLISVMLAFIFHLLRGEFYKTIPSLLVLLLQLVAALGCLYLYFNGRMGTGIFATP